MQKTCKNCQQEFEITDEDLKFYEKVSPEFGGKKYLITPPTLCPTCRMQRRMAFRNERKLYMRKCDLCGQVTTLLYSPDKNHKIYCRDCWWGDNWDPTKYGREFDFSKSFFEQFEDLINNVPLLGIWNIEPENSDYNNNTFRLKNSYMNFNSDECENIFYNYGVEKSVDIMDSTFIHDSQLSYECIDSEKIYRCMFSQNMKNSSDCYFSSNLIGCTRCFGSHELRNKDLYIYNEQVSLETWNQMISNFKFTTKNIKNEKEKSYKIYLSTPKRFAQILNCENSIGDQIRNYKNAIECFDCKDGENIKYISYCAFNVNNSQDAYAIGGADFTYEVVGCGFGINASAFIMNVANGFRDSYYCIQCGNNSSNLFGCVGLKHKQYCIFNKQYTKEEYEQLVPKIIEHMSSYAEASEDENKNGAVPHEAARSFSEDGAEWGEFFPPSISTFGYNETVAQEYFPLTKNQAISKGFKWCDFEPEFPKVEKIVPANLLPENISDIPDDILNWAIECEITKKPFKIIKLELDFYRKMNLPIPHLHPDERHKNRMALRNPRKLFDRNCMKCNAEIKTTYAPERPEIVYCEKCYLESVY